MNYQNITDKMLEDVTQRLKPYIEEFCPEEIVYYAWPQMFGSTTGPFGGVGGQACTMFTIEAFVIYPFAIIYCGGKFWFVSENFIPMASEKELRRKRA